MIRVLASLCLLAGGLQASSSDWSNLKLLHPGENLTLDQTDGRRVNCAFVAVAEDSLTVRIGFTGRSPEQLYDATYHVRILPKHIWDTIPRGRWAADTTLAHLVGSGPYRIQSWQRGRFLTLAADTAWTGGDQPSIRRAIWRFAPDPDAALNLILGHQADLMETVGSKQRVDRVAADSGFRLLTYPAGVYGFLAFRIADANGRAHPGLADRELR